MTYFPWRAVSCIAINTYYQHLSGHMTAVQWLTLTGLEGVKEFFRAELDIAQTLVQEDIHPYSVLNGTIEKLE